MSYTKNGKRDPNEYTYPGYGVSFSSKKYTHSNGEDCYDLVIFGVDMSNSKPTENEKNNILVLGKNALKINNTTIQPEAELKTNCFYPGSILSIHYNVVKDNISVKGYVYLDSIQQYEFKTKKSEILNKTLCLGNIVQYDDASIQEKTNFTGYMDHFSVDHDIVFTPKIEKIQIKNTIYN